MTSLATATPSLADQVADLLRGQVPARLIERVLAELTQGGGSDEALEELLRDGSLSDPDMRAAASLPLHLIGVRFAESGRIASRVRLRAESFRQQAWACSTEEALWLLVPDAAQADVRTLLADVRVPGLLAVTTKLAEPRLAPRQREWLTQLLDVGERRGWRGVADTARLDAAYRIEALLALAEQQPHVLAGPIDLLLGTPAHRPFAETLCVWLEHARDATATAAAMHLHVSTVRYRLRRAQELLNVDLNDWDQRLHVELQLRSWRSRQESAAANRPARRSAAMRPIDGSLAEEQG